MIDLTMMGKEIHEYAKDKGFYPDNLKHPYVVPVKLALVNEEVAEVLTAHRCNDDEHIGEEIADVIIRLLDLAYYLDIDIEKEIKRKHEINLNRPFRHGGKRY